MNVLILTSFGKISSMFDLHFLVNMLKFPMQDALIDKLDEVSDLLNYFLIIAKWHFWMSHKQNLSPNITGFKEIINMKYKSEKYIALKNNTQRTF